MSTKTEVVAWDIRELGQFSHRGHFLSARIVDVSAEVEEVVHRWKGWGLAKGRDQAVGLRL